MVNIALGIKSMHASYIYVCTPAYSFVYTIYIQSYIMDTCMYNICTCTACIIYTDAV